MKKKIKTVDECFIDIQSMIIRFFVEITFRDVFGTSPTKAFKKIYGKKWKKEGYVFDETTDKIFDKVYNEMLKERKSKIKSNH